jgi:hypothetical protein
VSGRITLHLDRGLGWTLPVFVACCRHCGTELARHPDQHAAERAARRRRCPACGTRATRRLPGTTSLATDLALATSWRALARRWRWPHDRHPHPGSDAPEGGESRMPNRTLWLVDMGDGSWAVCCLACRLAPYRGPKPQAERVFRGHRCEPVVPLGRRRRR